MSVKQYYIPNMPDEEAHQGFRGLVDKLRTMAGVHDVTVDRSSKHVTVHLNDDDFLPNVDQAILEFGQLPGFTGQ
jgi:hypothetical protein